MKRQPERYKTKTNAILKNVVNNERMTCDIINEEVIDGKLFYVVKMNNRLQKLAKDGFSIVKYS
jgi:hypothetical protein